MKKANLVPAVLFQRDLNKPGPVKKSARLALFERELGRIVGGFIGTGTISYDAPGVPGDSD
jgi:hypothetical protein